MPKIFYGILFSIIIIIALFFFTRPSDSAPDDATESESTTEDNSNANKPDYPTIILDAGHGGIDPGKVGVNNALEKDINLSIVLKLQKLLEDEGFTVHLTRNSDKILGPANSTRPKRDDMLARVDMVKELNPFFVISIHQNSFTDPSSSGPQTFYYHESEPSATMAQVLQDILNQSLNPEKNRAPQANTNYYLLTRTPTPTVIVECGFLSNPKEADLLISDAYQEKIATAIFDGILLYYQSTTSNQQPSE